MSYNIAICIPPVPTDDDEAWKAVDGLIEAKGPAPSLFKLLHDQLTSKYPCICKLPDNRVDEDGVWSDGPLWNDFGHRAAVLGIIYSRVEEVLSLRYQDCERFGTNGVRLGRAGNLQAQSS
jgi:hypothetical protein